MNTRFRTNSRGGGAGREPCPAIGRPSDTSDPGLNRAIRRTTFRVILAKISSRHLRSSFPGLGLGGSYFFRVIARLKPGVSLEQARTAMNVIAAGYRAAHPGNVDAPSIIEVVPLLDDPVGSQRESYLLLFGAVACVLLIACANIANLLLARFAGRRREIAGTSCVSWSRKACCRRAWGRRRTAARPLGARRDCRLRHGSDSARRRNQHRSHCARLHADGNARETRQGQLR
jgi:hypothetical protein